MPTTGGKRVQAVEHAHDILRTLADLDGGTLTELNRELSLSKSAIHNHLATLVELGYVRKDGSEYTHGLRCLTFGGYVRDRHPLFDEGRAIADELADRSGEFAVLAVEDVGQSVIVYTRPGARAVTPRTHLGIRQEMHCSAAGKAMLSRLPRERVEEVIERSGLPRRTEATTTEPDALFEELAEIRERGYALDRGERIAGMHAVAAPVVVRNTGELLGALSLAGPAGRFQGDFFEDQLTETVRQYADMIEVCTMEW
jgi:DNA-binding IclR family transcriptional regulator